MNILFDGQIESGKVKLFHKDEFLKHLASLEGQRVQVSVEKIKNTRTTQQNRYYWGVVLKLISQSTGHTSDELHTAFKYQFSPKSVVGNLIVPKSTRTQSTIEMTDYIEDIRRWAAEELGIVIPDPKQIDA